jgi:branched-chain amino acid transport system substrate-binding protein
VFLCLAVPAVLVVVGFACTGGGPVKVGAVLPLTGRYAIYGEPIHQGIMLAYEQVQADEDIGVDIEVLVEDSEGNPEKAAALAETLYESGAPAVIGGVTTDEALAMVPVADAEDKVLLSPSASSPRLTGISRNFFRVFPSDFREGSKMGNFAAQTLGIDRVVIMAAESPFARGIQDVFKSEFERYGGEVSEVIEYPPDVTDFDSLVERALAAQPVAVYVADYAQTTAAIIEALRRNGFDGKILATSAFASPEAIAQAGRAAEGVLLTQVAMQHDEPVVAAFIAAYEAKYGEKPGIWAAHGFDALLVIVKAIVVGGSAAPRDVWTGMRSIRNYQLTSGVIQFDEKGDVSKFPRTYIIEDGELIDYERAVEDQRQEILRRIEQLNRVRSRAQTNP